MDSLTGLKSQKQFALLELAENNKNSFLTEKKKCLAIGKLDYIYQRVALCRRKGLFCSKLRHFFGKNSLVCADVNKV